MKLENVEGYNFEFKGALDAFVFDETDRNKETFHGQPMKAVDIVAEFQQCYVFVEIKDYVDADAFDILDEDDANIHSKRDTFKWLKNYLKYKFRDSYLYRHLEGKIDKPIHYICLINFENALNVALKKALTHELPVGSGSPRWQRELLKSCQVVNLEKWNENFPKWPASRI